MKQPNMNYKISSREKGELKRAREINPNLNVYSKHGDYHYSPKKESTENIINADKGFHGEPNNKIVNEINKDNWDEEHEYYFAMQEKRKTSLGNTDLVKGSLWVTKKEVDDFDDGKRKGKSGMIHYLSYQLKNNPESSTYPSNLRNYHASVIRELKK